MASKTANLSFEEQWSKNLTGSLNQTFIDRRLPITFELSIYLNARYQPDLNTIFVNIPAGCRYKDDGRLVTRMFLDIRVIGDLESIAIMLCFGQNQQIGAVRGDYTDDKGDFATWLCYYLDHVVLTIPV